MKTWKHFDDECSLCGDSSEVFTEAPLGLAYDGDQARCCGCGCPGGVVVDEECGAGINWHDEPGCHCEWCKAHPVTP